MSFSRRIVFSLLLFPLLFCVSSCEAVPDQQPVKIKVSSLVVMPVDSLQEELLVGGGEIHSVLVANLQKRGYRVLTPDAAGYRKLLDEALVVSGSVYDPAVSRFLPLNRDVFIKALVDSAATNLGAELVLIPEVVLRTGDVAGDHVEWDGVARELEFLQKPEQSYRLPPRAKGASLRVAAYTRNGAEVYLQFGGISLPYRARYRDKQLVLEPKVPPYTSKEMAEGVNTALLPFFRQIRKAE
jgi:hypothetical protein